MPSILVPPTTALNDELSSTSSHSTVSCGFILYHSSQDVSGKSAFLFAIVLERQTRRIPLDLRMAYIILMTQLVMNFFNQGLLEHGHIYYFVSLSHIPSFINGNRALE